MAHAEVAERELRAAREQNAEDHERIAELEAELANAQRGVQRTKGRPPPADVSVNDTTFVQCDLRGTAIAKGVKGATLQQCDV